MAMKALQLCAIVIVGCVLRSAMAYTKVSGELSVGQPVTETVRAHVSFGATRYSKKFRVPANQKATLTVTFDSSLVYEKAYYIGVPGPCNLYFRGSGEALWETSDATQSTNYNAKNSAGDGFCSLTAEANGGQDQYFLIIFRREDTGYRSRFDVTFTLTSQAAVTTTTAPKLQPGVAKAVNSPAYELSQFFQYTPSGGGATTVSVTVADGGTASVYVAAGSLPSMSVYDDCANCDAGGAAVASPYALTITGQQPVYILVGPASHSYKVTAAEAGASDSSASCTSAGSVAMLVLGIIFLILAIVIVVTKVWWDKRRAQLSPSPEGSTGHDKLANGVNGATVDNPAAAVAVEMTNPMETNGVGTEKFSGNA